MRTPARTSTCGETSYAARRPSARPRPPPPELRAPPATLLGFAAWLSGNGALAWCAVDCAQQCDPDYSLAALLADALAGAVPPSVWRPVPQDSLTLFAPDRFSG